MAKSIIITGAGRGVGKSCAERFLKEGWSVGLIGRNPDPLSEMEKEHENAMALPCDVADAELNSSWHQEAQATPYLCLSHIEWHLKMYRNRLPVGKFLTRQVSREVQPV